jgi:hypothetical protein
MHEQVRYAFWALDPAGFPLKWRVRALRKKCLIYPLSSRSKDREERREKKEKLTSPKLAAAQLISIT